MHSSISSSDARDVVTIVPRLPIRRTAARRTPAALHGLSDRLPAGGLLAMLLVMLIHLSMAHVIVPGPVARSDLRKKILGLTQNARPSIVFAGDSRTYFGIDPIIVAEALGLPPDAAVNIALSGCEISNIRLGLEQYADRLNPGAITVINVSPFTVNDASVMLENETVRLLDPGDRVAVCGFGRTLRVTLLPELAWLSYVKPGKPAQLSEDHRGFHPLDRGWIYAPNKERIRLEQLWDKWFGEARMQAKRWALFEDSIRRLDALGYQLVLTSPPVHPVVEQYDAERPEGRMLEQFDRQIRDFAREHNIPCLAYRACDLNPENPASVMADLTHVNPKGAERLSRQLAHDLRSLIDGGDLTLPQPPSAAHP